MSWPIRDNLERGPPVDPSELQALLDNIEVAREHSDHSALVDLLCALGALQYRSNELQGAEASFVEALMIVDERDGGMDPRRALILEGLGVVAAQRDQHARAIDFWNQAINGVQRNKGVLDVSQARLLERLANSQTAMKQYEEAEKSLQYAVKIQEHAYGRRDTRIVPAHTRLAEWYAYMGELGTARVILKRMLQLGESKLGKDAVELIGPLRALSRSYRVELIYGPGVVGKYSDRQLLSAQSGASSRHPSSLPPVALLSARSGIAEGEQAILRAVEIAEKSGPTPQKEAALLEAGDWFALRERAQESREYYARAVLVRGQTSTHPLLEAPELIFVPAIAANASAADSERYASVQFMVRDDGKTTSYEVLESNATREELDELERAVRYSRYRPRFSNGVPVAQLLQQRHVFR